MSFDILDSTLRDLIAQKEKNQLAQDEIRQAEAKRELEELFRLTAPFSPEEMTPEAKAKRVENSERDFWFWDKIYFPPDIYRDYAPPGLYHRQLISLTDLHDKMAHIRHGARGSAKTINFKKKFTYDLIHGRRRVMGIGSEIMLTANQFLLDIILLVKMNAKLQNDYKIEWLEQSGESIFIRTDRNPKGSFAKPFSLERSTKAAQRLLDRLDYMFLTDVENITSSYTEDAVKWRIAVINEMRTSLSDDGTLVWEGNNLNVDCAMNKLVEEKQKGLISENFDVQVYPAWAEHKKDSPLGIRGSIWPEKWPATSEDEMRAICKPKDDADWSGNFQGAPEEESGDIFPKEHYHEWDRLPPDVKAVIYVDPNLSLKSKGDTTAMTCLGFSASMQRYYITGARCRSYSDSNEELKDLFTLRVMEIARGVKVRSVYFDGNVTQESTWTNNIRNFSRIHGFPFPPVQFRNYHVEDLTKNANVIWTNDQVYFPPGFSKSKEGKVYMTQVFKFRGKKAKKKDDAPDSMICALESLNEEGIISLAGGMGKILTYSTRQINERL